MNPITPASKIASKYEDLKKGIPLSEPDEYGRTKTLIDIMEEVIDDEFMMHTSSIASVIILPPKGSLSFGDITTSGSGLNSLNIATGVAKYWLASFAIPGMPMTCGFVVSSVNDAMKIVSPLKADLDAIADCSPHVPDYLDMCDAIIKHVKTINWTVTEADPSKPCTSTGTITIS